MVGKSAQYLIRAPGGPLPGKSSADMTVAKLPKMEKPYHSIIVPRLEAKMIRLIGYSARPADTPGTLPDIGTSVMVAPLLSTLVVEELQLDRVLVRAVAHARRDVRIGTLDVEVVPVRE